MKWNGTLVSRRDNQFVLDGYSKRLSPDVVRTHIRRRAPQLAKPHGAAGEYEEQSRRAKMSQMQAEIAKMSMADRRVRDLERLRLETSGSMLAPPQVLDMWRSGGGAPPRSKSRQGKDPSEVDLYAPDAWLTPPPSGRADGGVGNTTKKKVRLEPELEPEPEPEPEPIRQEISVDANMQLHGDSRSKISPSSKKAAAFSRQLSQDLDNEAVSTSGEADFILGMSGLRGSAQAVLDKGLGLDVLAQGSTGEHTGEVVPQTHPKYLS